MTNQEKAFEAARVIKEKIEATWKELNLQKEV